MISREIITFFRSIKQEKLDESTITELIKIIDDSGTNIKEEHWLFIAALCNFGKDGEMNFSQNDNVKFFDMLKKSKSKEHLLCLIFNGLNGNNCLLLLPFNLVLLKLLHESNKKP